SLVAGRGIWERRVWTDQRRASRAGDAGGDDAAVLTVSSDYYFLEHYSLLYRRRTALRRIACGRRRMIFFRRRTEQPGEDRLQSVRPHLIALDRGMQLVRIHHSFEEAT